jgi:hypothetical protein
MEDKLRAAHGGHTAADARASSAEVLPCHRGAVCRVGLLQIVLQPGQCLFCGSRAEPWLACRQPAREQDLLGPDPLARPWLQAEVKKLEQKLSAAQEADVAAQERASASAIWGALPDLLCCMTL